MQILGNCLPGIASIELSCDTIPALTPSQTKVISNTAYAIAIINKNIRQQLKLITQCADLSSTLANKAIPRRPKNKPVKHTTADLIFTSSERLSFPVTEWRGSNGNSRVLSCVNVTGYLIQAFVHDNKRLRNSPFVKRKRLGLSKCIYLLPRGNIDDAVISHRIVSFCPRWLMVNGDFSCPLHRHTAEAAGMCHVR